MGPSQISDTPFQDSLVSTLAIPKLDVGFCELYKYVYIYIYI